MPNCPAGHNGDHHSIPGGKGASSCTSSLCSIMVGMTGGDNVRVSLDASAATMAATAASCASEVEKAAHALASCLKKGGTAYFCGNGGSAADAQPLAAELAGRFYIERPAMAGVALSTTTSSFPAIGNDYGYEFV